MTRALARRPGGSPAIDPVTGKPSHYSDVVNPGSNKSFEVLSGFCESSGRLSLLPALTQNSNRHCCSHFVSGQELPRPLTCCSHVATEATNLLLTFSVNRHCCLQAAHSRS